MYTFDSSIRFSILYMLCLDFPCKELLWLDSTHSTELLYSTLSDHYSTHSTELLYITLSDHYSTHSTELLYSTLSDHLTTTPNTVQNYCTVPCLTTTTIHGSSSLTLFCVQYFIMYTKCFIFSTVYLHIYRCTDPCFFKHTLSFTR
jgi:hypothetical protein